MASRSKIAYLPAEIRDELDKLVKDGRFTIAQIRDHLRRLGAEVSWSGVQREVAKRQQALERFRQVQDIARTWTEPLGEGGGSDVVQLLVNMLQPIIYSYLESKGEDGKPVEAKELAQLTRMLRDLVTSVATHTKHRVFERDVVRAKVVRVLDQEIEKAKAAAPGTTPDIPEEALKRIRERVYGVFE